MENNEGKLGHFDCVSRCGTWWPANGKFPLPTQSTGSAPFAMNLRGARFPLRRCFAAPRRVRGIKKTWRKKKKQSLYRIGRRFDMLRDQHQILTFSPILFSTSFSHSPPPPLFFFFFFSSRNNINFFTSALFKSNLVVDWQLPIVPLLERRLRSKESEKPRNHGCPAGQLKGNS